MIVTTPVPSYYGFYQKANTNNKIIKIKYSQKKFGSYYDLVSMSSMSQLVFYSTGNIM